MGSGHYCFLERFCSIYHEWLRTMHLCYCTLLSSFKGGPKPFRFENFWTRDNTSWNVIFEAWNSSQTGSPAHRLIRKIWATRSALRRRNKACFGTIHTQIQQLRHQLDYIQQLAPSDLQYEAELTVRTQLQEEMKREEMLWHQKSRINWLTTKDLNTKHFHVSTLIRRRRNCIEALQTAGGRWLQRRKEIGDLFVQHFKDIYKSSNPKTAWSLEDLFQPVISSADNVMLCSIPSAKEIHMAVASIGASKAPGPDGMTALFF